VPPNNSNQKYFVLLILTDGLINDMQNTVDAIVAAATLPFRYALPLLIIMSHITKQPVHALSSA
jgi:Copine